MNSRSRTVGLALLAIAVTLAVVVQATGAWTNTETVRHTGAERPHVLSNALRAKGAGLEPRRNDPALPPLEWTYGDPEAEAAASDATNSDELMKSFYHSGDLALADAFRGFLDWALPFGHDGTTGESISRCAARYEPELEAPCLWRTNLVIARTSETSGELRYAKVSFSHGEEQHQCKALASCVTSELVRDSAPIPLPETVGDLFAVSQPGRQSFYHAGRGVSIEAWYSSLESETLAMAASAPTCADLPGMALIGCQQNLVFLTYRLREIHRMQRLLAE